MAARLRLEGALLRCCRATVPVLSAAVALGARCLSGRDKVMTLWIALVLWAAAVTSEARLFSQPTLALLAWTALFALPPAYSAGRRGMDALAEELLGAAAAVIARGGKATAGLVAGGALAGWTLGGPGIFGQALCSVTAAVAVLAGRAASLM